MRLLLLPLALSLALAPWPASSQPQDAQEAPQAQPEEAGGATPWQAQIYSSNTNWSAEDLATGRDGWDLAHKCGGSLIADGWVLTAAHCINETRIENGHRVRLGATHIDSDEGATYRIDRMVRHADWNKDKHLYDVALVHFVADDETNFDTAGPIEPIPLYDGAPLEPGVEVFATGWGQLESGQGKGFQSELTQVDLVTADCAHYPQYEGQVQAYQLCATGRTPGDDADTCTGDSGGPLVTEGDHPQLVGVVNWGNGCYRPDSAGIYLRIDNEHFRDWIERAMAADPAIDELR